MVTVGLLARGTVRPGKENEVSEFLRGAVSLAEAEPATAAWFAIRFSSSEFGIFDVFPDDAGRQAHLNGPIATALMAKADEFFTEPPTIEPIDIPASKLPGH